ncbi:MAG: hypothetical protein I8H75_01160 [Myxococcaceae bacterium]|nr:hypothetical protein [Myxococcaceae bacterium]MBH2005950.1 hypothetical protein [Myxococcaceae bacterium]
MNNSLIKIIFLSLSSILFANDDGLNTSRASENELDISLGYNTGNEPNDSFLEPEIQRAILRQIITTELQVRDLATEERIQDRFHFLSTELELNSELENEVQLLFDDLAQAQSHPDLRSSNQALCELIFNTIQAGFFTILNEGIASLEQANIPIRGEQIDQLMDAFQGEVDRGNILLLQNTSEIPRLFLRLYNEMIHRERIQSIFRIGLEPLLSAGNTVSLEQREQMAHWLNDDLDTGSLQTNSTRSILRRFQEYYQWLQPIRSPILDSTFLDLSNETALSSSIESLEDLNSARASWGSRAASR